MQISNSGIATEPAIRGISTDLPGQGQDSNVAVYVDGIYNSDNLAINQDFANIKDVEILKGPQGSLYGRNATGGAILITTRSPTDKFEAEGSVDYAPQWQDRAFSAYVAGPLAHKVYFGISGYYRYSNGFITDINKFAPNAQTAFPNFAVHC